MQDRLNKAFTATVELEMAVDPSLVGGTVIRVGDTVYDGSIANRLSRIKKTTRENTIREIRLTTERFVDASQDAS